MAAIAIKQLGLVEYDRQFATIEAGRQLLAAESCFVAAKRGTP